MEKLFLRVSHRIGPFAGAAAALLAIAAFAATAKAQTFSPIQCSTCPTRTEVNWSYGDNELPADPNSPSNYINNLHHQFLIFGNQYVKEFGFRVDSFSTEATNDYLEFGPLFGTLTRLSGTPATGWRDFSTPSGLQAWPGIMLFRTDPDGSFSGFATGKAREARNPGVRSIDSGRRRARA